MAIELPPRPSADDDARLALLEDPALAERLFRENPALFALEPPRTEREVLAWTTRRISTLALAVTAAASIAAGYFGAAFALHRAPPQPVPVHAVAAPVHGHASAPAHRTAHHPAPVAHAIPASHHAAAAAVPVAPPVVYRAPVAAPQPDREAQLLRAKLHAQQVEMARLRAQATEAAAQAARAHAQAVQAQAAARARVQSEPATATAPQPATAGENAAARTSPLDAPQPEGGKPATNPNGGWTSHGAFGVSMPGGAPVIFGPNPADPCTPHGGRTGIVMQMVQAAAAAGLSRLR